MAHLMTILLFLAMGAVALGIIAGMAADYAERIATLFGVAQPAEDVLLMPTPLPRRNRAATRPVLVRREARWRAAA